MIKFFRKIRQNLLMENKTGRYFKYAIGEIILVVIGILIALSINNWNTGQKALRLENEQLINIYESLQKDSLIFAVNLKSINEISEVNLELYLMVKNPALLSDTFNAKALRRGVNFNPTSYGIKEMVSTLSNEEIRVEMSWYYLTLSIVKDAQMSYSNYIFSTVRPFLSEHGVHNLDALYESDENIDWEEINFFKNNKLRDVLGTTEFEQILFELKVRIDYFIQWLKKAQLTNEQKKTLVLKLIKK